MWWLLRPGAVWNLFLLGPGMVRWRHVLYVALVAAALIVLPTGTPEDLVTTALFIEFLGLVPYLILALLVLILVLLLLPKRYRRKLF